MYGLGLKMNLKDSLLSSSTKTNQEEALRKRKSESPLAKEITVLIKISLKTSNFRNEKKSFMKKTGNVGNEYF